MGYDIVGIFEADLVYACLVTLLAAVDQSFTQSLTVLGLLEQEEGQGDEEGGEYPIGSQQDEQLPMVRPAALGSFDALPERSYAWVVPVLLLLVDGFLRCY